MPAAMRVRSRRPATQPEIWVPPHVSYGVHLPVPDPITFAVSPQWCERTLFPRQATVMKVIFLRVDLLTDYDYKVIAEWEDSFRATGNFGTPPGLVERMKFLRLMGHKWFREMILVIGRRGGKGYLSALCMAYVMWNYLAKHDPQKYYEVDRDKQLTCLIYAGKKDQAKANLWRDLVNVIQGAPCFAPYISKPMGESLSVYAPADRAKMAKLAQRGIISGLDQATFRIDPLPATPMSGRGGAGFMIGMDEMAHMINTGANREAKEVWDAATPSLAQFAKDAFIACPSSPWQEIGQFFVEWKQAQEIDKETGRWKFPEKFTLQLPSWGSYDDWEIAHEIDLLPPGFTGDLGEYEEEELPRLPEFRKPVIAFEEVKHVKEADPDTFSVEYESHWQTTLDAYLDPTKIAAMFDHDRPMVTHGALIHHFKAHGDPGFVNDPFGFAVAHLEEADDGGLQHVVFDFLKQWNPVDYPNHTVDYTAVQEELWGYVKSFPLDDLSFDQHNSRGMTAELSRRSREAGLPKRCTVHIINETAPYNLKVAETFKIALNQGWIHAPYFETAELELKFLMFKNGKVQHQEVGPVVHDDVARAMMEVTFGLLEKQVTTFLMQGASLTATMSGTGKPFMHPDGRDKEILNQFSAARRNNRPGSGNPFSSPARGRPGLGMVPSRTPRRR
jgi:hypothetical protein